MMSSLFDEAREMVREMPFAVAAFVAAVVVGVGAHATVIDEADGEALRLVANRHVPRHDSSPVPRAIARLRSTCEERIPGFTVIVGLSDYSLELSIPTGTMHTVFETAQGRVAKTLHYCQRSVA